jgi:hypothetical protein
MKISMTIDHRTYAGEAIDIVRKLRADAIHMKTRDVDAYMRAVVTRLRAEQQVDLEIEGDTVVTRCEFFLAGIVRSGLALPVFQREYVDSSAIRVLRRARRLTQEELAARLDVSFATVNRWEAGEHLPSSLRSIEEELFHYFSRAPAEGDAAPAAPVARVAPAARHAGALVHARDRARQSFRPPALRAGVSHRKQL